MPMDIDGLQIEITENSEEAVSGLDALTQSLERLKKVTGDLGKSLEGVDFDKFGKQIKQLSTALQPLQGFKTQASGLLSSLRHFTIMAEDFNEFTRFDKFASQIKLLSKSLEPLSGFSTKLGATLNALSQVSTINEQLNSVDFKGFGEKITTLTQSLSPLSTIQSKLGATLNQLSRFGQVTQQLDMVLKEVDVSGNILRLVKALEPLTILGKSPLGSILNQLKKLPEIMNQLASIDMDVFANQINRVVTAIKPLADEMNKVAAGFSAFPARIQKLITQNERLSNSNNRLSKSYNVLGINIKSIYVKLFALHYSLRRISNIISDWVIESNKYVENLNLFRVSMRDAADEALNYAFKVQEAFGIDPSEWIRYQAVFQNMATGFGITAEKATIMSKALTQLGYDLATIFNVDYATAMEKLESAIAGQPRPMREWGFDMSEATLKLVAMKLGIEENVEKMTQFEKAQLRFVQLMETARQQGILGNFAREIHTPANALRIFNQQILFFRRALGNLMIPILIKVLPYLQAFVQLLAEVVNRLALFFGFQLPKIDYSGLQELGPITDDIAEGLDDATDSAKKLKNALAPFDEINLLALQDLASSGEKGGIGGAIDLGIDFEKYDYDFIGEAIENQVDRIMDKLRPTITWVEEHLDEILEIAKAIGVTILAWKLSTFFLESINKFKNVLKGEISPITKIATGLTLLITGIYLEFTGAKAIGKGEAELFDYIKTALGAALGIAGSLLIFGTGPLGWTIGIGAALTIFITGVTIGRKEKLKEEDLAKRFGDIVLSKEEIEEWAKKLTTSDLTIKLDLFVEEKIKLDDIKKRLEESLKELDNYNFRVKLGLDVSESSYKSAIDSLISNAQEYLDQKHITAALAVEILLEGTETGERLSTFVSTFYDNNRAKLQELGNKLKKTVEEGFVEGRWIENKFEEAMKLQSEIQEILNYIADLEFRAKMETLKMDFKGTDLTYESFKEVMNQAQEYIDEQKKVLETIKFETIKMAIAEFDLTGDEEAFEKAKREAEERFNEQVFQLNIQRLELGLDTLQEAFREELTKAEPVFATSLRDAFHNGFLMGVRNPEEIYQQPLDSLLADLQMAYRTGIEDLDISSAARKNIKEFVKEMQPTKEQLEEIAESSKKAGQTVPEHVSKGLRDIAQLEALSGSLKSMNYMMGTMLSTDTSFLELLATSKKAGKQINADVAKGIADNIQLVTDEAGKTITGIKNTVTGEVINITPTLVENLETLGFDISNSLITGARNELETQQPQLIKDFETAGNSVSNGLLKGVEDQLEKNKPWYLRILDKLPTWLKNIFGISSPSTVFKGYGKDIMQGLISGMQGWDLDFKNIFESLKKEGEETLKELKEHFENWTAKIKLPHFSWDYNNGFKASGIVKTVLETLNLPTTIPKLKVEWYATGGFPTTGQLFIAREAGPELVGTIGNRTAVVNNEQIVEAVSRGVFEAVSTAMQLNNTGTEGPREIVINLEGKPMARVLLRPMDEEAQRLGYGPILRYREV